MKKLFGGLFKVIGFIVCLIFVLALFAGDDESTTRIEHTGTNEVVVVDETEEVPDFEFIEEPVLIHGDYGIDSITGIVKNNTDKDTEYIDISFILYDADGNMIGTAYANGNVVKAGGTWKFEAVILEDGVASFEFDDIDSF